MDGWKLRARREAENERSSTDHVELHENTASQLDVFFLYVLDGDEHSSEVSNVREDLLFSCTEAAD